MSAIIKAIEGSRKIEKLEIKQLMKDWENKTDLYAVMAKDQTLESVKKEISGKYEFTVDVQKAFDEINKEEITTVDDLLTKRMFCAERITHFMNDELTLNSTDIEMIDLYLPELNGTNKLTSDVLGIVKDNNLKLDALSFKNNESETITSKAINAVTGTFIGGISILGFAAITGGVGTAVLGGASLALGFFGIIEEVTRDAVKNNNKDAQKNVKSLIDKNNQGNESSLYIDSIKEEYIKEKSLKNDVKKFKI